MSRILLYKPESGATAQCAVQHGHAYVLDFNTSLVTFCRENGDLALRFEDGACLLLRDFYHESQIGNFFLELRDGAVLLPHDIIEAMALVPDATSGALPGDSLHAVPSGSFAETRADSGEHDMRAALHPGSDAREASRPGDLAGNADGAGNADAVPDAGQADGAAVTPEYAVDSLFSPALSGIGLFDDAPGLPEGLSLSALSPAALMDEGLFAVYGPSPGGKAQAFPEPDARFLPLGGESIEDSGFGTPIYSPLKAGEPESLLLEDLLDTTMPELVTGAGHASVFETLFQPGQDDAFYVGTESFSFPEVEHLNARSPADTLDESSDQLLLAFLNMGSF